MENLQTIDQVVSNQAHCNSPAQWRFALRAVVKGWLMLALLSIGTMILFGLVSNPKQLGGTRVATVGIAPAFRLDLNLASAAQLQTLPDVGVRLSQRIVEYRTAQGAFQSIDELLQVRGVGTTTLDRLRPLLWLDDDT